MEPRFLRELGEFGLIQWIAERHPDRGQGVIQGIGDDAAVLAFTPGHVVLASADALVENVHFKRDWFSPSQIGRKAAAVNLSDMLACGARGRFLLCQAGLPRDTRLDFFQDCILGLLDFAREAGLTLVGGDITATGGPLFLAVTILGEALPGTVLTRSGARPGDVLLVSGRPGEAAAGLLLLENGVSPSDRVFAPLVRRHLEPSPPVETASLMAEQGGATAAIDLSDGLSSDLWHICRASGVSAVLDAAALPVSPLLEEAGVLLGRCPLDLVTGGGEDYELLITAAPEEARRLLRAAAEKGLELRAVGRIEAGDPGVTLVTAEGPRPLPPSGYNHFPGSAPGAKKGPGKNPGASMPS